MGSRSIVEVKARARESGSEREQFAPIITRTKKKKRTALCVITDSVCGLQIALAVSLASTEEGGRERGVSSRIRGSKAVSLLHPRISLRPKLGRTFFFNRPRHRHRHRLHLRRRCCEEKVSTSDEDYLGTPL